jgi:hypothetical protein
LGWRSKGFAKEVEKMEKEIEEKIELYSKIYEEIWKRMSNIENAKELSIKILEEIAKDLRSERIDKKKGCNKKNNQATKKQRGALKRFGIRNIPENLSKKEASDILNRLIGLSKEDKASLSRAIEELNKKLKGGENE